MTIQMSPEQIAVIDKVRKLLALAANNPSESEAESATAKAMELLEAHNLSMHQTDDRSANKRNSNRDDKKRGGGLYGWQRKLWSSVCELNFCMHWSIKGLVRGSKYEHRILGRQENVIAAEIMAEYLQQTTERLAQRWARDAGYASCFVREAIAYREGVAQRLAERLAQLRRDRLSAERARAEAERQANPAKGTELALADTIDDETWLNYDHLYGYAPGTTKANMLLQRARQAEAQRQADIELAKRDEAEKLNPALKAARIRKEQAEYDAWAKKFSSRTFRESSRNRAPTAEEQRRSMPSYRDGYIDADDIGLDKQIDKKSNRAIR